ncbi:MAG: hypothetical protein HYZ28_20050 [Myxococcales bacterium]|nr:hypothetical protein [Myxococcales bacterium]
MPYSSKRKASRSRLGAAFEAPAPKGVARASARELLRKRRQLDGWVAELASQTDEVRRTEAFRRWFGATARLWRYSFFNQWLISEQMPSATSVAGRAEWARLGRSVAPGAAERQATLLHEIALELLHPPGDRSGPFNLGIRAVRTRLEAEADAVAWVVCKATSQPCPPSPEYVAWHGATGKVLLRSMKRIAGAARAILHAMEGKRIEARIPDLEGRRRAGRVAAVRARSSLLGS